MAAIAESRITAIAQQIAQRLLDECDRLRREWQRSAPTRHFVLDDLLPAAQALEVYERRPASNDLLLKRSLRESKRVGVSLARYDATIGEHLLAFQKPEVVAAVAAITGIEAMEPDPSLYASGISVMENGDFLNPHLDNSHDGDQKLYRAVNLLYYISPGWRLDYGGNFELWTPKLDRPSVIESRFNRLLVMETTDQSWHSVQRVRTDASRVCLSNYYFSPTPPRGRAYRNVTSFRGRPEEHVKRVLLRIDAAALNLVGRVLPFLLRRNPHRRTR